MAEPDLPEPKRRLYSPEERIARRWHLVFTCLVFCTVYTLLHKLAVPLILKFSSLQNSPYSKVDFWFFYPVLFVAVLRYQSVLGKLGSFMAGVGILYGAYEVFEVISGHYGGWLAFSRLLSSVPIAICCGFLMSMRAFGRNLSFAWGGVACLGLVLLFPRFEQRGKTSREERTQPKKVQKSSVADDCGAKEVVFASIEKTTNTESIRIMNCGLKPNVIVVRNSRILIQNELSLGLNLHLLYFENGKKLGGWNEVVSAGSQRQKEVSLSKDRVGLLYSDSAPQIGITLLIHEAANVGWRAKRNPIRVWRDGEL